MKTVVIRGAAPLPDELRDVIARGSTSVVEREAAELDGAPPLEADRILFWNAADDPRLRALAERYAERERRERRESLLFVTSEAAAPGGGDRLRPDEVFLWPRDEDRLVMAFMTSA